MFGREGRGGFWSVKERRRVSELYKSWYVSTTGATPCSYVFSTTAEIA